MRTRARRGKLSAITNKGDTMNKHLGPIALSAAMLGLVAGGAFAATHAFAPVTPEPAKVQFVSPAAATVTSTPTPTVTVTATPKPVVKKAVAPKPVQSVKKATTQQVAPQTVQRQA